MTWFFVLLLLVIAAVAGVFVWKTYGSDGAGGLFGPKPERRLAVVEQASIDGKRRMILLRRDNVEHLIITGGPVDVVVETGIGATVAAVRSRPAGVESAVEAPAAVFGRAPRSVSQVAGE
jgi:flagellar protein FliO/FliZ